MKLQKEKEQDLAISSSPSEETEEEVSEERAVNVKWEVSEERTVNVNKAVNDEEYMVDCEYMELCEIKKMMDEELWSILAEIKERAKQATLKMLRARLNGVCRLISM